jgi:hypothetical protein
MTGAELVVDGGFTPAERMARPLAAAPPARTPLDVVGLAGAALLLGLAASIVLPRRRLVVGGCGGRSAERCRSRCCSGA